MQISFQNFIEEIKKIGRGIKKLRFFQFVDLGRYWRIISRKEKIFVSVLVVIFAVNICIAAVHLWRGITRPVPAYGSTYIEGLVGQPRFINPLLAQSQTDKDLVRLVFSGLYKYDDQGNIVPDLAAASPSISKNLKELTVKLRSGLKWHDGKDITADDVMYTVQTLQNTDYKSPLEKNWRNTTVKKIDNLTIEFINKDASAPFINNLTLGILPQHLWAQVKPQDFAGSELNLEPTGSGPYFAKEITKAVSGKINSYSFDSYSKYWAGKPYIDEIDFKFYDNDPDALLALHSKDIDGFGFEPFDKSVFVDAQTNLQIKNLPLFAYEALFFNTGKGGAKIFGDSAVRTALAQAVDRNNLVQNVYNNLAAPAYGPILPQQLGYDPAVKTINSYNLDSAKQILDKDGWVMQSNGIRAKSGQQLHFTITTNDFVLNVESAKNLKDQFKAVGADVGINIVQTADLEKNYIMPRNYDALLFAEGTGFDPDPFAFWHSSQAQDPGFNLSQYKNTKADRLISDARHSFDNPTRATKYSDFQKIILVDAPAIFLNQASFVYELEPKIQGVSARQLANPEDRFYDVERWYISTRRVLK